MPIVERELSFSPEVLAASLIPGPRPPNRFRAGTLGTGLILGFALGAGVTGYAGYGLPAFLAPSAREAGSIGSAATIPAPSTPELRLAVSRTEAGPQVFSTLWQSDFTGTDVPAVPLSFDGPTALSGFGPLHTSWTPDEGIAAAPESAVLAFVAPDPFAPALVPALLDESGPVVARRMADGPAWRASASLEAATPDRLPSAGIQPAVGGQPLGVINAVPTAGRLPAAADAEAALQFPPDLAQAGLSLPPEIPPSALRMPDGAGIVNASGAIYRVASSPPDQEPPSAAEAALELPPGLPAARLIEARSEFRDSSATNSCSAEVVSVLPGTDDPLFLECGRPTVMRTEAAAERDDRSSEDQADDARGRGDRDSSNEPRPEVGERPREDSGGDAGDRGSSGGTDGSRDEGAAVGSEEEERGGSSDRDQAGNGGTDAPPDGDSGNADAEAGGTETGDPRPETPAGAQGEASSEDSADRDSTGDGSGDGDGGRSESNAGGSSGDSPPSGEGGSRGSDTGGGEGGSPGNRAESDSDRDDDRNDSDEADDGQGRRDDASSDNGDGNRSERRASDGERRDRDDGPRSGRGNGSRDNDGDRNGNRGEGNGNGRGKNGG